MSARAPWLTSEDAMGEIWASSSPACLLTCPGCETLMCGPDGIPSWEETRTQPAQKASLCSLRWAHTCPKTFRDSNDDT